MDIFGSSTKSSDSGSEKCEEKRVTNKENMYNSKWIKQGNIRYNLITPEQGRTLEREFIKRKLKFNKSNVRKLARELKLPYKKSIEYFMSKVNESAKEVGGTENLIREIEDIQKKIDEAWEKYLEGCRKYKI